MIETWMDHLVVGGLIVVAASLGVIVARLVSKRASNVIQSQQHLRQERRQQLNTLVQMLSWGASIAIGGMALLMVLSEFGVDITPLLTSAGVAGLAISLGAQTLLKDFIGGFFILVENQYAVGDTIQVGPVTGIVERLTLRATYVRDVNGNLNVVPNGEVRIVTNQTRDWSRALVDFGVAYEADLTEAMAIMKAAAEEFAQDPVLGPEILEPPQVLGPLTLGDWAVTVRVMVKTRPGQQWSIGRELRQRILNACNEKGIELPYPRQEILVRTKE